MGLLGWALTFLIVAIIAAAFGFGRVSAAATDIAKILFFIFVTVFIVLLILGLLSGGTPRV